MGLEKALVGISHECDYPASIRDLPRLSRARLDVSQPSHLIHEEVAARARRGLSLYDVDAQKLAELKPDLAAGILMKLDARKAGVILNEMKSKEAAVLTTIMASAVRRADPS